MKISSSLYYEGRVEASCIAAHNAVDIAARVIHLELAHRYRELMIAAQCHERRGQPKAIL